MTTSAVSSRHPLESRRARDQRFGVGHYREKYMTLPWILSCWTQAKQVAGCGGKEVMEIGVGTGQAAFLLKKWGHCVFCVDFDADLCPDVVADIVHLPFTDGMVDTVLAAEVLEHLPFDLFVPALTSLRRVARKNVVITLPCRTMGVSLGVNLPLLEPLFVTLGLPYRVKNMYDGVHYWEMGRKGFGRPLIRRKIREAGLSIVREFRVPLNLFCYGFVLRCA